MLCFLLKKNQLQVFGFDEWQDTNDSNSNPHLEKSKNQKIKVYLNLHQEGNYLDLSSTLSSIWKSLYPNIQFYKNILMLNNGGFTDSRILYIWLKSWSQFQSKELSVSKLSVLNEKLEKITESDQDLVTNYFETLLSILDPEQQNQTKTQEIHINKSKFDSLLKALGETFMSSSQYLDDSSYNQPVRIGKKIE